MTEQPNIWKCAICEKEFETLRGFSNHLRYHPEISIKDYYDSYLKREGEGVCPVCGKPTKFAGLNGYKIHCSVQCTAADPKVKQNKQNTFLTSPKLRKGSISLSDSSPEIAKEWDYEKNKPLSPEVVTNSSNRKVWWLCPKGHHYEGTIISRTKKGCGCPYCSGHRIIVGQNDLQTTNPQLAEEWHPTKNGSLKPSDVMRGSNKKVWWLGKCGHEWYAAIYPRSIGVGCPRCKLDLHTSFSEQSVFFYIKKYFPDAKNGDKETIGMELDIYIPSHKIAIEYDGKAYHQYNKKTDILKNMLCKKEGILLIRIQEVDDHQYDDCICLIRKKDRSKKELDRIICDVLELTGIKNVDVDVSRDEQDILSLYYNKKERNSLQMLFPELAKEWHPSKNGFLSPDKVISGSMQSVWWLAECGHEWKARIAHRINGVGCPYCSGNKVLKGFNDIQSLAPELAKEWDYQKNKGLKNKFNEDISTPDKVAIGSGQKVWWLGRCGHSWEMSVAKRRRGDGCPYCSNHRLLVGFNDVASRYPDIASEWHPTKNGDLMPDMVVYGAGTKVWWLGPCGHEWSTRVVNRTIEGAGCPYCSGSKGAQVICIETGTVFSTLGEASKATGAPKASIVNCCKGRQQKAGGFHWKYYEISSEQKQ